MSRRHSLPNPFSDISDLSSLFGDLNLHPESESRLQPTADMEAIIARLEQQMTTLLTQNATLVRKVTELEEKQAAAQQQNAVTPTQYEDVTPTYATGDSIQLDAFKVIPEFNGDRKAYRSWRSQVMKMMKQIENFKAHPKYAAALSIIRAKITKNASDILVNNDTVHNIDAIIDRLDFSYSDQRPLYVIEAEMTTIRQNGKTLQEYYDDINQALNMVLTKIAMTYKEAAEQRSLTAEVQSKAIRTFITGLNSVLIRNTLYGSMPDTLSKAFSVAQTIQYDNKHLHLEFKKNIQPTNAAKKPNDAKPNFNPNPNYQAQQMHQMPKQTFATPPQPRQREPSFQYNKPQPSYQHVNKQQRVNHVDETTDIRSIYDDSMENNCETETEDLQTTMSERESIFLEE